MSRDRARLTFAHAARSTALVVALVLVAGEVRAEEIVDPRSGRLALGVTDLSIPVGPIALEWTRTLRARSDRGPLGTRWRSNWESRVLRGTAQIVVDEASGAVAFGPAQAGPGFVSTSGERLVVGAGGGAVRTKSDGVREFFDARGRLIGRDLRNGNRIDLRYAPDGRLARIDGPRGSFLQMISDDQGRLLRIETSIGTTVRYGYVHDGLTEIQVDGGPLTRYLYDARGALIRIERPATGAVDLSYDTRDRVVSRRWADGTAERWEYEDAANRQRHVGPTGAVTTVQWSGDRSRADVTDALGRQTSITYDGVGRPLSVTDPTGAASRMAYDALGRPVAVWNAKGQATRFEYVGDSARIKTVLRKDGTREAFEYDGRGNLVAIASAGTTIAAITYHPDGSVATVKRLGAPEQRRTYDPAGRLLSAADPLGGTTRFEHDKRGKLIRETNPLGGATLYGHDAQGRLVGVTDPAGGATRYVYDARGRLESSADPGGGVTRYQYDARGRRVAVVDPEGRTVRHEYDAAGRIVKTTWPDGTADRRGYDAAGNLTEWTDRLGRTARLEFDALGRLVRSLEPMGLQVRRRYDVLGKLIAVEETGGDTLELAYDAAGRLTASVDALNATTRYAYDPLGRLIGEVDPRGQRRELTYGADGALVGVREPSGDEGRYDYDPARRLVSVRRPSGGTTRFTHDGMGNVVSEVDALGNRTRWTHDAAGRVVTSTDAAGRVTRFAYDGSGRLAKRVRADGVTVTYQYDTAGRLVGADDGVFPVSLVYDRAGRLQRQEYGALKKAVTYEYDAAGLRTKLTDASGRAVRYEYDAHKRLSAIVLPDGQRLGFDLDEKSRLRGLRYPNGITGRWEYGVNDRTAKITYTDASGAVVRGWTYRYDAAGNLTEEQDSQRGAARFQYDAVGQLTEAAGPDGTVQYRYVKGGNRLGVDDGAGVVSYRHDAADRLIQAGREQLGYDADGRLIARTSPAGRAAYEYDADGQLVKVTTPVGTTAYGYAPTGERVSRRDGTGLTRFIYDGLDLIEELTETGAARAAYVHGPGIDHPLALLRDGRAYFYHSDRLGSVRLLTDASGRVAATYEHDPFGKPTTATVPTAPPNPFTFTGREWDAGTGLYYMRARYYDPALGRFVSPDPLPASRGEPRELNPYLYVGNRPLVFVDPLGLAPERPLGDLSLEELVARKQRLTDKILRAVISGKSIIESSIESGAAELTPREWRHIRRWDAVSSSLQATKAGVDAELAARGYTPPPPSTAEPPLTAAERGWLERAGYLDPEPRAPRTPTLKVPQLPAPKTPTLKVPQLPVPTVPVPPEPAAVPEAGAGGGPPAEAPPAGYKWGQVLRGGILVWTLVSIATSDNPAMAAGDAALQIGAGEAAVAMTGCSGGPGFMVAMAAGLCVKFIKDKAVEVAVIAANAPLLSPTHPENIERYGTPGQPSPFPTPRQPLDTITSALPGAGPSQPSEGYDPRNDPAAKKSPLPPGVIAGLGGPAESPRAGQPPQRGLGGDAPPQGGYQTPPQPQTGTGASTDPSVPPPTILPPGPIGPWVAQPGSPGSGPGFGQGGPGFGQGGTSGSGGHRQSGAPGAPHGGKGTSTNPKPPGPVATGPTGSSGPKLPSGPVVTGPTGSGGTVASSASVPCTTLCQKYCVGGVGVEAFAVWKSGPKPPDLTAKCSTHCSKHWSGVTATQGDTVGGIGQCLQGTKN